MVGPLNPKDENKVIGPGTLNEVSKSPWECRISKRAKEAQRKQMGQGCPKRKTKGTQEPMSKKNQWPCQAIGRKSKQLA